MGTKVPKQISDYPSFGLDFGISCQACGRIAVYRPVDVDAFFSVRSISTKLPVAVDVFTCKCGSRDVKPVGVAVARRPSPQDSYGRMLHPMYILRPPKP
ncbi:hypothetical protein [Sphingomonas sp. UYP23]